jgi:hypothetical protein
LALSEQLKYWKREAELLKLEVELVFQRQGKIRLEKNELIDELERLKLEKKSSPERTRPTSARATPKRPSSAANIHAACHQKIQTLNNTIQHQEQSKQMVSLEFSKHLIPLFKFKRVMDRESFSLDDCKDLISVFDRKPDLAGPMLEFLNGPDPVPWFQSYLKLMEDEIGGKKDVDGSLEQGFPLKKNRVQSARKMVDEGEEEFDEIAEEFSNFRQNDHDDDDESVDELVDDHDVNSEKGEEVNATSAFKSRPVSSRHVQSISPSLENMKRSITTGMHHQRLIQDTEQRAEHVVSNLYNPELAWKTRPMSPVHPRIKRTSGSAVMQVKATGKSSGIMLVARKAQVFSRPSTASLIANASNSNLTMMMKVAESKIGVGGAFRGKRSQSASVSNEKGSSRNGSVQGFLSIRGEGRGWK